MPHSSGGGSHSGGSHSGGSHSSHGGSGRSTVRTSKKYFPNARRFRYVDNSGVEHFLYSEIAPRKQSKLSFIFTLIFFLPFLGAGFGMLLSVLGAIIPPIKLNASYTNPSSHIEDNAGVIDNADALEATLQSFQDTTGICPIVVTVTDSYWYNKYSDLESYAFAMYTGNFEDEQHFLVVYSEPDNANMLDYVDWQWEAVQGDDTDRILTGDHFSRFRDDLHSSLDNDYLSVGQAADYAFKNSLSYMMDRGNVMAQVLPVIFFSIVWYSIIITILVFIIKGFITSNRDYEEVPLEGTMGSGYTYGSRFDTNTYGANAGPNTYKGNGTVPGLDKLGLGNNDDSHYGVNINSGDIFAGDNYWNQPEEDKKE